MVGDTPRHPVQLGKYRIDGVLGEGGMGVVYRGYDSAIDRVVAVKTIHRDLLAGERWEEWRNRFQQEARAAGRCLHPNVVTVFDYGEAEELPFLAMEYIQGCQLSAYLDNGAHIKPGTAGFIGRQVLAGLGHAHDLGVVHRDIKPANIFILEGSGQVKVTDFGIAHCLDIASLTQTGMMIGTPSYMSPEQFTGGTADPRSDLYSVAIVLYELLAGRRPFLSNTAPELMYQILSTQPPPVSQLNPAVPVAVDAVLNKAMARDPSQRFSDAAAFAKALRAALPESAKVSAATRLSSALSKGTRRMPSDKAAADLSPEVLHKVEQSLASHIGPLARLIVKRAAQQADSLDDLYQSLADNIPNAREKKQFLRRFETEISGPLTTTSVRRSTPEAIEPAVLAEAQQALTLVMGPIARILVKKAAAESLSVADLYQRLAQHIADPQERAAFLRRMPS